MTNRLKLFISRTEFAKVKEVADKSGMPIAEIAKDLILDAIDRKEQEIKLAQDNK